MTCYQSLEVFGINSTIFQNKSTQTFRDKQHCLHHRFHLKSVWAGVIMWYRARGSSFCHREGHHPWQYKSFSQMNLSNFLHFRLQGKASVSPVLGFLQPGAGSLSACDGCYRSNQRKQPSSLREGGREKPMASLSRNQLRRIELLYKEH